MNILPARHDRPIAQVAMLLSGLSLAETPCAARGFFRDEARALEPGFPLRPTRQRTKKIN